MTKLICVAVDIEKSGCMFKYPIVSIGFVVGHKKEIYEKKRFNIQVNWEKESNGGDFEDRCYDEFWSKQPQNIIDECIDNALSAEQQYPLLAEWINQLETTYPSPEYKISFLTDNASFDIASIDYGLEKYLNRKPMRYSSTGKYRSIISADDMLYMLNDENKKKAYFEINKDVVHDHNPVNDAHFVYLQYYYALLFANMDYLWHY